jgi:hypothetical protein
VLSSFSRTFHLVIKSYLSSLQKSGRRQILTENQDGGRKNRKFLQTQREDGKTSSLVIKTAFKQTFCNSPPFPYNLSKALNKFIIRLYSQNGGRTARNIFPQGKEDIKTARENLDSKMRQQHRGRIHEATIGKPTS